MNRYPDIPPIWAAGIAALAILASKYLPVFTFSAPRLAVWGLLLLGFGLILWSAFFFWKKETTIEPHHTPTNLIVEGPYKISRNPIYLGMFLGVFGVALWSGGLTGLFIACFFPVIVTRRFVAPEEQTLREQFGAEAENYISKTARWFLI